MAWTFQTMDGKELDPREVPQPLGAEFGHPDGPEAPLTYREARLKLERQAGEGIDALVAERERCARIAESPTNLGEWIDTTRESLSSFKAGYDAACTLIAKKIREGA